MPNPLTPQGTLNRLRASIVFNDHSELNVTPDFLAKEMIRLAFNGPATTAINTGTGIVQSPEPYQLVVITINLLKTQPLADLFKSQLESNAIIGDCTVRPDVSTGLSPYQFTNCAIQDVNELDLSGQDPKFPVMVSGYYNINSSLWDGS